MKSSPWIMNHDLVLLNATVFILLLTSFLTLNFGTAPDDVHEETHSHYQEGDHDERTVRNNIPVLGPAFDYLGVDQHLANQVRTAPVSNKQVLPDRHITFTIGGKPGLLDMATKVQQALEIACMLRAKAYVQSPRESLSPGHNGGPVQSETWDDYLSFQVLDPRENLCETCGIPHRVDPNVTRGRAGLELTRVNTPGELLRLSTRTKINLHVTIPKEDLGMAITLLSATIPRCKSVRVYPGFAMGTRWWFQKWNPEYMALKIRMGDDTRLNTQCADPRQFKSYLQQVGQNVSTIFVMGNFDKQYKEDFITMYGMTYVLVFEDDLKMIVQQEENYSKYLAAYAVAEGATQGIIQVQRKTKWDRDGKLPTCKVVYYAPREESDIWWTIYSKASKVLKIN